MTELSTPPDREVEWRFHRRGVAAVVNVYPRGRGVRRPVTATVRARSWFAARDLAAAALGVGRDEVEVVR